MTVNPGESVAIRIGIMSGAAEGGRVLSVRVVVVEVKVAVGTGVAASVILPAGVEVQVHVAVQVHVRVPVSVQRTAASDLAPATERVRIPRGAVMEANEVATESMVHPAPRRTGYRRMGHHPAAVEFFQLQHQIAPGRALLEG